MLNYIIKIIIVSVVCGGLGYFAGKEYRLYQIEKEIIDSHVR